MYNGNPRMGLFWGIFHRLCKGSSHIHVHLAAFTLTTLLLLLLLQYPGILQNTEPYHYNLQPCVRCTACNAAVSYT